MFQKEQNLPAEQRRGSEGAANEGSNDHFIVNESSTVSGLGASELQGGGSGDASRNTWFTCALQPLIWILLQKYSHTKRPPLVTASQIALSPMVVLLATASRLFSRPLLILLCCLISKDLPYTGFQSQLDVTTACLHASPPFSYRVSPHPQVRR